MKRTEGTTTFGRVLHQVFERLEEGRKKKEGPLFDQWPKWIGKNAAQHSRPVRVKEGCLLVYVDHPTWLYELNQKKKEVLLQRIHRELGKQTVKRILFRLGEV